MTFRYALINAIADNVAFPCPLSSLSLTDSSVGVSRRDIEGDDELHGGEHFCRILGNGSSEKARHAKQSPC